MCVLTQNYRLQFMCSDEWGGWATFSLPPPPPDHWFHVESGNSAAPKQKKLSPFLKNVITTKT